MDKTISFSKDFWAVPVPCTIEDAIEDIQAGRWEARVAAVRAIPDEAKREEAKRRLPAYVFGGTFSGRRAKDALQKHSGFLVLDFDAKDNPGQTAEGMRALCAADVHCVFAFASARGGGCKAVVRVEAASAAEHERCFDAAAAWFKGKGLVADPTGRDVCRLCFVSHDPGLLRGLGAKAFAPVAAPIPDDYVPPLGMMRATDLDDKLEKRARAYLAKMPPAIAHQHGHDALFDAARALAVGFCLSEDDATRLIMEEYNPRCEPPWSEKEIRHKVKDAAKNSKGLTPGHIRDKEKPAPALAPLPIEKRLNANARKREEQRPASEVLAPFLNPGGLVQDVADYVNACSYVWQPEFSLMGGWCVQSVVGGRCTCTATGTHGNLYVLAVAPSGRGKDAVFAAIKQIFGACNMQGLLAPGGYKSGAALAKDLEDKQRMLVPWDELGQTFKILAGGERQGTQHIVALRTNLLEAATAARHVNFTFPSSKGQESRPIDHPFLSVYGAGTPQSVFSGLSRAAVEDGFLGRWLIVPGREEKERREPTAGAAVPDAIKNAIAAWQKRMDEAYGDGDLTRMALRASQQPTVRPRLAVYEYAPEAKAELGRWLKIYDAAEDEGGDAAPLWTRAYEKAHKLALLHAENRAPDARAITKEDAEYGGGLANALTLLGARQIAENLADSPIERLRKELLEYIREGRELGRTQSDVTRNKGRWATGLMRKDALEALEEAEEIVATPLEPSRKGGPRGTLYRAAEWYSAPPIVRAAQENNVKEEEQA